MPDPVESRVFYSNLQEPVWILLKKKWTIVTPLPPCVSDSRMLEWKNSGK